MTRGVAVEPKLGFHTCFQDHAVWRRRQGGGGGRAAACGQTSGYGAVATHVHNSTVFSQIWLYSQTFETLVGG